MVRMPIPEICLCGEDAYTIEVPMRRMHLYDDMMRVQVFTALFHIWYAPRYSPIKKIKVTRVPWTNLSLAARTISKAVLRMNGMIVPPPTAPSAALKTDFSDICITRRL